MSIYRKLNLWFVELILSFIRTFPVHRAPWSHLRVSFDATCRFSTCLSRLAVSRQFAWNSAMADPPALQFSVSCFMSEIPRHSDLSFPPKTFVDVEKFDKELVRLSSDTWISLLA